MAWAGGTLVYLVGKSEEPLVPDGDAMESTLDFDHVVGVAAEGNLGNAAALEALACLVGLNCSITV